MNLHFYWIFFVISDLTAGQEAHVYKYADRTQLIYQCQITITVKEPNGGCTRPQCPEPQGYGASKRHAVKRLIRKERDTHAWYDPDNTMDVRTEISALEITDDTVNKIFKLKPVLK